MGVEERTPGYLVKEELQRNKLWGRAGRRAMAFKKKLNEGKGSEQARRCWEEKKDTQGRENKIEMGGRKEKFLQE